MKTSALIGPALDCAALCANDIELWIDRCPHCGKPRHNHPPTDDELLNKPEQVESKPVPDFRGYAALGTGQYLLNACPATEVLPAELVISIATEEEKAGRVIGDLKDVEPGTEIDPSSMAVRLAFFSVSGLDALEQQLRILREESFPNTTPQPGRTAELEAALKVARDGIDEFLVANDPTEFGCACDLSVGYLCGPCHAEMQQEPLKIALAKINEVLKPPSKQIRRKKDE